ncbi:transposase [Streptomyces sp. NPDC088253]|uniref:transposase n=1 Tax=Streptomyces sp. NPDC088253 TaxID=3365846 RepID=UPI00381F7EC2
MTTRPWIVDDDLWARIEPLLPPWPERSPAPKPAPDRLCLQDILYVPHQDMTWQLLPLEPGFGSGQTCVLGDEAYDSQAVRRELRRRRIMPVVSCKGASNIKGPGKLRYVVEQTFALLHRFKRLAGS